MTRAKDETLSFRTSKEITAICILGLEICFFSSNFKVFQKVNLVGFRLQSSEPLSHGLVGIFIFN